MSLLCACNEAVGSAQVVKPIYVCSVVLAGVLIKPLVKACSQVGALCVHYHPDSQQGSQPCITRVISPQCKAWMMCITDQ